MIKSQYFYSILILLSILIVAGCASEQSANQEESGKTEANQENQTNQANEVDALPSGDEFSMLIKSAQQEGTVVVYGPPGEQARIALTKAFEDRYGITVNYQGGRTSEQFAKLQLEYEAGKVSGDVLIGGPNTLMAMYEQGVLRPLRPQLVDPEVKDENNWVKGEMQFSDPEKQYIVLLGRILDSLVINTDLVKEGDIQSAQDLLDPKWKGRIGISDPTVPGSGNQFAVFALKEHGPDFVRDLYINQEPEITRDIRLLADNLVRGQYAFAIGVDHPTMTELKASGITNFKILNSVRDLSYITPGYGTSVLLDNGPNPNAGALYANWLLSEEGQTLISSFNFSSPIRKDVPLAEGIDPSIIPDDSIDYPVQSSLDYIKFAEESRSFFAELLK